MRSKSSTKKGPGRVHYPGITLVRRYLKAGGKAKYGSIARYLKVTR